MASDRVKNKAVYHNIRNFVHLVSTPIGNEKRRKAIANILSSNNDFNEKELIEIWKGLYFAIWYTEVAKCEELIFDVAYGCRLSNEKAYLIAGFKLLAREWMGIDFYRVDKYALLVRHMINRSLRIAILESDPRDFEFLDEIFQTSQKSVELCTHIIEVYLDELKNVTMRQVIWNPAEKSDVYVNAIKPVIKIMSISNDSRVQSTIKEYVFIEMQAFLSSDCESKWQDRFYQSIFKELLNAGKGEEICLKNRKALFDSASLFKESC